jgi:hypothetical protein
MMKFLIYVVGLFFLGRALAETGAVDALPTGEIRALRPDLEKAVISSQKLKNGDEMAIASLVFSVKDGAIESERLKCVVFKKSKIGKKWQYADEHEMEFWTAETKCTLKKNGVVDFYFSSGATDRASMRSHWRLEEDGLKIIGEETHGAIPGAPDGEIFMFDKSVNYLSGKIIETNYYNTYKKRRRGKIVVNKCNFDASIYRKKSIKGFEEFGFYEEGPGSIDPICPNKK